MYLYGAGTGFQSRVEDIVHDLAVVVHAVKQAHRHRVLLPDEPARITKSLRVRQGVSCTEENTDIYDRDIFILAENSNEKHNENLFSPISYYRLYLLII